MSPLKSTRACALLNSVLLFAIWAPWAPAQISPSNGARQDFPITDNTVVAMIVTNGVAYLGGAFSEIGVNSGSGVVLSVPDGAVDFTQARTDGSIQVVVPDGNGGWFIGGDFSRVGGILRRGIAHIRADGTVNPGWTANINAGSSVLAIALAGSSVYVGGTFTSIGGQNRLRLAELRTANGAVQAWNPGVGGNVRAIGTSGTRVFVGGSFTNIAGQDRLNLASIDATSGEATGFNPAPNEAVHAVAVLGSVLYCGGAFTNIAAEARGYVAALNAFSGTLLPLNPNPDGPVASLTVNGDRLLLGGSFTAIAGAPRPGAGMVNASSGEVDPWNPAITGTVAAVAADEARVYLAGSFARAAGGNHFDIVSLTTGATVLGQPLRPGGPLHAVAVRDDRSAVFAGGSFARLDPQPRAGLAAIRIEDGAILPFDAGLVGPTNSPLGAVVNTLTYHNDVLYAGGLFVEAGGKPRTNLVAVAPDTGTPLDWAPASDGEVTTLLAHGTQLFVSGIFRELAGASRTNLGAVSLETGEATPWAPNPNNVVGGFAVGTNGVLYAGGAFNSIAGVTRGRLAAFDLASGDLLPWDPFANGPIETVRYLGDRLLVGGAFTSVGGLIRSNLAAITPDVGNALEDWSANANNRVRHLHIVGNQLFVAGDFSRIADMSRSRAAVLSLTNAAVQAWNADFDDRVYAVGTTETEVIAGGRFLSIGGPSHIGLAAFRTQGQSLLSIAEGQRGTVLVQIDGNNGERLVLEATTNLVDWVPLVTNTVATGVIKYTESTSANPARNRHYRARSD